MRSKLSRNYYFIIGFVFGVFLSVNLPENLLDLMQNDCNNYNDLLIGSLSDFGEDLEPHLNLISKPLQAKKQIKNVIRPRYYSSELGIKEKFFIGVMTSQDNINTLSTAINRTTAHLVNKIKFFINANNVKINFKLKNIVGFTDTRENLRPFHILKYIGDNYLEDYDYFLIIPDTIYLDIRKLLNLLYHISVTFDIYMGTKLNYNSNFDDLGIESDHNYCDLNSGILLSSSVIKKMRNNLDWCVRNAVTNIHSINIGRCVKYSTKVPICQDKFQDISINSFDIENYKIYKDLKTLQNNKSFQNSQVIYPVTNIDDFYILHAYFSKLHLELLKNKSLELETKTYAIGNGTITNNILEKHWPLGVSKPSMPETRHDILNWHFVNRTHIFMPNHENVIEPLKRIDSDDLEKILNITMKYAKRKYKNLTFKDIHTIYRKFDPTRGMDYHLHLNFVQGNKIDKIIKSFYAVKPLGRMEIINSPYVTESTRLAILLPILEHQLSNANDFIRLYEKICMSNQDNTFLMLIFIYRYESSSKGDTDPFRNIKTLAIDLSTKYQKDGSRIAWLSVRLPEKLNKISKSEEEMLNSIYGENEILSLAITDLSLPKLGLDTLVLLASNSMTFKIDFFNRIRMNTIQGFQIFSPIGFQMYPCGFANFCKECDTCDVSQGTGYFDKFNYDVVSFYSRDYVEARKKLEEIVPIVKYDTDIEALLNRPDQNINNVVDIFVRAQLSLHILRGIEPNLRYGNSIKNFILTINRESLPKCPSEIKSIESTRKTDKLVKNKCIHIAARKQIGDAIVRYEDHVLNSKTN